MHNSEEHDIPDDVCDDVLEILAAVEAKQKGNAVYMIDPKRCSEFAQAYADLKRIFGETNKVSYKQREGIGKTGWDMFVTGKSIDISDTSDLIDTVLDKADCFEVSAYMNGVVELAVTFYGVLKKVGD